MTNLTMTGYAEQQFSSSNLIFCPSLKGLTERQADLAFVMPRINHNKVLGENDGKGCWGAVLACDPFGSEQTLLRTLQDRQYKGLTNWPSSILLEGLLRQSMSTIPATPEQEYRFLSRAGSFGFETMAFFLSMEQALLAIHAGLRDLVLHPGLLEMIDADGATLICASFQSIIDSIKDQHPDTKIFVYTTGFHEKVARLSRLEADGFITFEDRR